jgi:hypothetical protein
LHSARRIPAPAHSAGAAARPLAGKGGDEVQELRIFRGLPARLPDRGVVEVVISLEALSSPRRFALEAVVQTVEIDEAWVQRAGGRGRNRSPAALLIYKIFVLLNPG